MIIATIVILFAAINARAAKCAPSKGQFAGGSFNLNR